MGQTMSILTATASHKTAAQAKDAWALAPLLVVMCLIGLVLAIASEPFARAVELMGLS
jgi:hypothetical protein